jgi:hypothetical protein
LPLRGAEVLRKFCEKLLPLIERARATGDKSVKGDVAIFITVTEKLGLPFDRNAKFLQLCDQ